MLPQQPAIVKQFPHFSPQNLAFDEDEDSSTAGAGKANSKRPMAAVCTKRRWTKTSEA